MPENDKDTQPKTNTGTPSPVADNTPGEVKVEKGRLPVKKDRGVKGSKVTGNKKKKGKRGAPPGNKNAVGNPGGGRPSKFDPKYGEMLIKFMDVEPFRKELKVSSKGFGKSGNQNFEREEYQLLANKLPTLNRFAMSIGVHFTTLENWVNEGQERIDEEKALTKENAKNPEMFEFFLCFKTAKEVYKEFIVQNGLAGLSPSPFAMFVLKNTTDMKDKSETDITSGGQQLGTIVLPATQPAWPAPDQENGKKENNN